MSGIAITSDSNKLTDVLLRKKMIPSDNDAESTKNQHLTMKTLLS